MTSNPDVAPQGVDRRTFLAGVVATGVGVGLAGTLPGWRPAEAADAPKDLVKKGTLGRTGLPVSRMVFGAGGLRSEDSRLLQAAFDRGVTTIDTAWGYGNGQSEVAVGGFLKGCKDREKVVVITKASGFRPAGDSTKAVFEDLKVKVEESLKRMNTEYVDVFLCPHGASDPANVRNDRMKEVLTKLKEAKLVRHLGFSSHTNTVSTCTAAIEDGFYDVVLTVINVCTQNAEKAGQLAGKDGKGRPVEDTRELVKAAQKKNVGLLAMKVANGGYLTPATDDLLAKEFPADSPLSRAQKLYTYGLRQEGVSAVLAGLRSVQHLQEAVAVGSA